MRQKTKKIDSKLRIKFIYKKYKIYSLCFIKIRVFCLNSLQRIKFKDYALL